MSTETRMMDRWQRYAEKLATAHRDPEPEPEREPVEFTPADINPSAVRQFFRGTDVKRPLTRREIEALAQMKRRVKPNAHKGRARITQLARCCGRKFRRWKFVGGKFICTGQQCIVCEKKLKWRKSHASA